VFFQPIWSHPYQVFALFYLNAKGLGLANNRPSLVHWSRVMPGINLGFALVECIYPYAIMDARARITQSLAMLSAREASGGSSKPLVRILAGWQRRINYSTPEIQVANLQGADFFDSLGFSACQVGEMFQI